MAIEYLKESQRSSFCEWKGTAKHYSLQVGDRRVIAAAWAYPLPLAGFTEIKGHFAFYAQTMDECTVDGEKARPQPGRFYGGWVTDDIVGPFKGEPGTENW